ncbi:MAG: hypothetical protein JO306_04095 [Gemmatimonadetes bacterium]|nr:hypothetical protein [Gemmatimonadota bacterium]
MRYDRGYGRDYGWNGGRMGGMPRYDDMFRGRERHAGPPQGRRGRDAGRMGWRDAPTAFGSGAHGSPNQQVAPGETDFLGRPYSRAAMDNRPWGLIEQERMQAGYGYGYGGYDRGGGYDAGYRPRPRGYDRGFAGPRSRGGYDEGFGARGAWQMEGMRPEDYHPRFIPDSDEAGMDVHRYGHGGDMRYTSNWTRWF